jgi:hypothetical protein
LRNGLANPLRCFPDVCIAAASKCFLQLSASGTKAAAVIYYLVRMRSAVDATNSLIRTLILHAIPSGAITALCAMTSFALYKGFPGTKMASLTSYVLGRLYSQALLNTLNLRKQLRHGAPVSHYTFRSANHAKDTISFPNQTIALDKISVRHERTQQVEIGTDEKLAMDKRYEVDSESV